MMRKISSLVFIAVFICMGASAKIWRVNNMPGVTADFTTAQAAHDGANAGDTIHLEPSVNSYGGLSTNKKLYWVSIGSFLTQNPGNQFSTTPGIISSLTVNPGSTGSIFSVTVNNGVYINSSGVTVTRTQFDVNNAGYTLTVSADNVILTQGYTGAGDISIVNSSTNATINNNIVAYLSMSSNTTAAITNNVFSSTSASTAFIYNSVFQNNIMKGYVWNFVNSTVSYCMHAGTGIPAGNNNQLNVNMANVFVNDAATADKDYILKTGSPAIGTGFGGVDMGAFGGTTPFKLALQPPIPAITNLSSPSSSGGTTIQVTFSAKSNN